MRTPHPTLLLMLCLVLSPLSPPAIAAPSLPEQPEAQVSSGDLSRYLEEANKNHPAVEAAFHRWEAAVHQVARSRALPEPKLKFAVFLQSVETRVGPQQAKIGIEQAFPWPTKLIAGGQAASSRARAAQQRLEATSLAINQAVQTSFWNLWEIRTTRKLHLDHLQILNGLSTTVRSRVEIGAATLADLQQIDLSRARLEDRVRSLDEAEMGALATLRAAVGRRDTQPMPTEESPQPSSPTEGREALQADALHHPNLASISFQAEAADSTARSLAANRLPGFSIGADWVVTGVSAQPDAEGSGKDAIIAGVGLRIPLWQSTYGHEISAAKHAANALRSDHQQRSDLAIAEVDSLLSKVRDSGRRVDILENTLLPLADAAYASVLGGYTVGQSAVAQTLLSQSALLDLGIELAQARADHQRAWAALENTVGHSVSRAPLPPLEIRP